MDPSELEAQCYRTISLVDGFVCRLLADLKQGKEISPSNVSTLC